MFNNLFSKTPWPVWIIILAFMVFGAISHAQDISSDSTRIVVEVPFKLNHSDLNNNIVGQRMIENIKKILNEYPDWEVSAIYPGANGAEWKYRIKEYELIPDTTSVDSVIKVNFDYERSSAFDTSSGKVTKYDSAKGNLSIPIKNLYQTYSLQTKMVTKKRHPSESAAFDGGFIVARYRTVVSALNIDYLPDFAPMPKKTLNTTVVLKEKEKLSERVEALEAETEILFYGIYQLRNRHNRLRGGMSYSSYSNSDNTPSINLGVCFPTFDFWNSSLLIEAGVWPDRPRNNSCNNKVRGVIGKAGILFNPWLSECPMLNFSAGFTYTGEWFVKRTPPLWEIFGGYFGTEVYVPVKSVVLIFGADFSVAYNETGMRYTISIERR